MDLPDVIPQCNNFSSWANHASKIKHTLMMKLHAGVSIVEDRKSSPRGMRRDRTICKEVTNQRIRLALYIHGLATSFADKHTD